MTYKCPNCGGAIVFDSDGQQFKCESCDSVFTQEQLKLYDDELKRAAETEASEDDEWNNGNGESLEGMNVYSCEFCGAQIVADETTAASECPYCNNPIIMKGKLTGMNRPDYIIPFEVNKDDAVAALRNFYKRKVFLPDSFADENRIKEIKGVYVPFWLFDCDTYSDVIFKGNKTRSWSDSKYNYIETSNYRLFRSGNLGFDRVPVDGSEKMDDAYMDAIEPFDYNKMKDFDAAYLSGYIADKYDVDAERSKGRAAERVRESVSQAMMNTTHGFGLVTVESQNTRIKNGRIGYALFPVWMLNTKYNDKTYTFAMNGQTGKLVGELPIDKSKVKKCFLAVAAAIAAVGQVAIFVLR